jgi:hypothetical protein
MLTPNPPEARAVPGCAVTAFDGDIQCAGIVWSFEVLFLFLWANESVFVCPLSLVKFTHSQIPIHEMNYDPREQHPLGLR